MRLVILECVGCNGWFPPAAEEIKKRLGWFLAGAGWMFNDYVNLSGSASVVSFFHKDSSARIQPLLKNFSEQVNYAYCCSPNDSFRRELNLKFGQGIKVVAEFSVIERDETGFVLAAYLKNRPNGP